MPEDTLTLTVRLHDPKEKNDAALSACWATVKIPRGDLELSAEDFAKKYIVPLVDQLENKKSKAA